MGIRDRVRRAALPKEYRNPVALGTLVPARFSMAMSLSCASGAWIKQEQVLDVDGAFCGLLVDIPRQGCGKDQGYCAEQSSGATVSRCFWSLGCYAVSVTSAGSWTLNR